MVVAFAELAVVNLFLRSFIAVGSKFIGNIWNSDIGFTSSCRVKV